MIEWTPERTPRCCNPLCHTHTMEWHDEFKLWMCESCGCTDQTIGQPPDDARESPQGYMREDIAAMAKA